MAMAQALVPHEVGFADEADSKQSACRPLSPSRAFRPAWLLFATHQEDSVSPCHPERLWFPAGADGLDQTQQAAPARPVAALHVREYQSRHDSAQV